MRVVLVDDNATARASLGEELRECGCSVLTFADARLSFLFLLAKLGEIDAVAINVDEAGQGAWLLERLEMLPVPLSVVTYSANDRKPAEIQRALLGERGVS